jgi:spore coat protein U-like protein
LGVNQQKNRARRYEKMKKLIFVAIILTALVALSVSGYAATTTSNLDVSANVVGACTVTTSPVNFGDIDGMSFVSANGDVTVNCPTGTNYNIALDAGLNYDGGSRNLVSDDAINLRYRLESADTMLEWGDMDFANTYPAGESVPDTGNGLDQPHTVQGTMDLTGMTPSPGLYTDVVGVTVHY